jgi:hypothetical protein
MEPLHGRVVPCPFEAAGDVWERAGALTKLEQRVAKGEEKLPPAHLGEGADGLRRDLQDLGIFLRLRDDRVNIPDVFRVGYGLGRRGVCGPFAPVTRDRDNASLKGW